VNIVEFATDPQLLGLSISPAQEALLRAIYALPMTAEQREIYHACTGRERLPAAPFPEATIIAGARSGKDSRILAPGLLFEALFGGHEHRVAKGERAVIPLVAQDARAVKVAYGYIRDYLLKSPLLSRMVADEPLVNEIKLVSGITIMCFPCTLRSLRGWSIPAAGLDEVAFFRLEGAADADTEVQASVRRGMIAFDRTRLIKISTPYMRGGVLFDDFKRAFGVDDPDLLCWRASSLRMNPSLKASRLERERRLDPTRFAREYEADFADDVDAFLPAVWVDAAAQTGRQFLSPQEGVRYVAAVDASGGGADAFTLAVVHAEGTGAGRRIVQDVMRAWSKPRDGQTDLEGAVQAIAAIVKTYNIRAVFGDRYARGWVREAFKRAGIVYSDATIMKDSEAVYLDRSAAYLEVEPLFAAGLIAILDHPTLARELKNLERRPHPGGKDRVDHPRGQHDDHANALALAAVMAMKRPGGAGKLLLGGALRTGAEVVAPVEVRLLG